VETVYLKASVQAAERELLKAALADADNQFFCLVSESCIPLHPFQVNDSPSFSPPILILDRLHHRP
jgi:Core-2/I-Branching enzyme